LRIPLRTRLQIVPTPKKEIAKNISIKVVHEAGVGVELQPLTPERIGERAAITWEDIRQYVQSFRAIPLGKTSRDKFRILLNNLRVISYPFEEAWIARHSSPLFRQRKTLYRCRKGDLVFCCANVGDELQFLESYEPHTWAELRKVTAGDFINVGSSIGVFAVSMAYSLGSNGRVVAIEPHPLNQELLERTVMENGLSNVKVVKAAAWSERTTLTLYEHQLGGAKIDHSTVYRVSGKALTVPAVTVDQVVDSEGLDKVTLALIDAEGAEVEILKGMKATLRRFPSMHVVFEALTIRSADRCRAVLADSEYKVRRIFGGGEGGIYVAVGPTNHLGR